MPKSWNRTAQHHDHYQEVTDKIIAILEKYRDMRADFADASLVALAERLNVTRVASVDRDFTIYRLSGRRRFENVFLPGSAR